MDQRSFLIPKQEDKYACFILAKNEHDNFNGETNNVSTVRTTCSLHTNVSTITLFSSQSVIRD